MFDSKAILMTTNEQPLTKPFITRAAHLQSAVRIPQVFAFWMMDESPSSVPACDMGEAQLSPSFLVEK